MALHHAISGELIDIRPLNSELKNASTKTLYKSNRLEVFRMVLLAGKDLPAHQVMGDLLFNVSKDILSLRVREAASRCARGI
jgi:hypothetical protein